MSHDRKQKKGLGKRESSALHIVEFSKGKPNELSLNVLDNRASGDGSAKKGFFSRLFSRKDEGVHPSQQVIGSDVAAPNVIPHVGKNDSVGASSQPASQGSVTSTGSVAGRGPDIKHVGSGSAGIHALPQEKNHAFGKKGGKSKEGGKDKENRPHTILGEDSQREIARRQRIRRVSRIASVVLIVCLVLVGCGFGGWYLYGEYQKQLEGIDLLKTAVGHVEESDRVVVSVDQYLAKPLSDETLTEVEKLKQDIPKAQQELDTALDLAKRADAGLASPSEDKEAAEHAIAAIEARRKLLTTSLQRLDEDVTAKKAYDKMQEAWASITSGNSLMSQSAKLVGDTNNENVEKATEYTKQAKEKFADAKKSLDDAKELMPDLVLDDAYRYLELRQNAIGYALKSNDAILIQDKKKAEKYNDKYNAADLEAVEIAKSFPDDFGQEVVDLYAEAVAPLEEQYDSARKSVGTHDSALRDYLGSEGWVS